jgi:hypothetical protein
MLGGCVPKCCCGFDLEYTWLHLQQIVVVHEEILVPCWFLFSLSKRTGILSPYSDPDPDRDCIHES